MNRRLLLIVIAAAAFGCATDYSSARQRDAELEVYKATLPEPNADYGAFPERYQEGIKAYLGKTLKDPYSAMYSEFSRPRQEHALWQGKAIYGWSACALVNAKNSYGGYTGNQRHWFFFQNGQIVRATNIDTDQFGGIIYRGRPINCADGPER